MAIRLWNVMGGDIEWAAVPWLCAMYGCEDIETVTQLLVVIRDHGRPDPEGYEE